MLTTTNTFLLEGLADPRNQSVWGEFHARYRPVILAFARKLGLEEADAEDAAQETLTRFAEDYRANKYERERGRLRSWIFTIARSRVLDFRRSRARARAPQGASALGKLSEDDPLDEVWDAEWRRAIVRAAFLELRAESQADPSTLRALELLVLEGRPAADVAKELGMKVGSVYVAKHRSMVRLREILVRLEEEF